MTQTRDGIARRLLLLDRLDSDDRSGLLLLASAATAQDATRLVPEMDDLRH